MISFFFQPPPKPFRFKYEAGRAPGGKPDRYVEQEGDGSGQIKGSYTYLDPNWTWQTVSSLTNFRKIFLYLKSRKYFSDKIRSRS